MEWKNALKQMSTRWSVDEVASVDAFVGELAHDGGPALVLIHGQGGETFVKFLAEPVSQGVVHEGPVPRLATIIEARQRALPHVVVQTDRAGADLTAFYGSDVLATEQVQGEVEYIHRGAPGGWSQKRFQQRAENTWEHNGNDVAAAVASLARTVGAQLIAVAGDVRAQGFVLSALPADLVGVAVKIDEGSPDGISDQVVRLLSSQVASRIAELADRLRTGLATGLATTELDDVVSAAATGRVDTLLVCDDDLDVPTTEHEVAGVPAGTRLVDAAIVAALRTDATIYVVPNLAVLDGPLAALYRW
ncbi:MAG: Vms1/Ankzf1 family peptidyl-tRNA hydrolase [Ilumatobacteraceae bacterium]